MSHTGTWVESDMGMSYGVATISRLLKFIGLFRIITFFS